MKQRLLKIGAAAMTAALALCLVGCGTATKIQSEPYEDTFCKVENVTLNPNEDDRNGSLYTADVTNKTNKKLMFAVLIESYDSENTKVDDRILMTDFVGANETKTASVPFVAYPKNVQTIKVVDVIYS